MTQILRGELKYNELTSNARGGTELMARRMVDTIPQELLKGFQIVHSRVRDLDPSLKKVLVLHDLPNDPESDRLADPAFRAQFDKIVCVSDWQLQMYNAYKGLPYSEAVVINNAIVPIDDCHDKSTDEINLIYHTTPHRGLALLVPVFEALARVHDDVRLHVYSSFEVYGWGERDKPYEPLFHACKNHPKIEYYGARPNDEVRAALAKTDVFAYPCIWPETSCLAAIEAFSARNVVVTPNYAGLTDTCARWADSYAWTEDAQVHANVFYNKLNHVVNRVRADRSAADQYLDSAKAYFDTFYNIDNVKHQWIDLLSSIK
jgi:glycosyltransferase involved in cell wall biosynthesis